MQIHYINPTTKKKEIAEIINGQIQMGQGADGGFALDTNNPAGDAFGRVRTSDPETVFESKLLDGAGTKTWTTETNGTGAGAKDDTTSCYNMTVSAADDYVIRQTIQNYNYQSGKSQLCFFTGILPAVASVTGIIGLAEGEHGNHVSPYPAYNGIYFESINGTVYATIINNGVKTTAAQSAWNLDVMDGEGTSGKTLDFTKCQIFVIDYEWLGVGRVRFGFNIDGVTYYCHEVKNANSVSNVYTKSPNLPVRYEVRSQGGTATMKQICASISSEGGKQPTGFTQIGTSDYLNIPTSGAFNTNPTTHTTIAAIRHQEDKPYSFIELLNQNIITLGASPLKWSIALVPGTTNVSINGTPTALDDLTFVALPDTTVEFYSFNSTQDTVLDTAIANYVIEEDYISDTFRGATASLGTASNIKSIGEEINGSRWCFLFTIQSYGANEARSSLKFTEVI
jgi:hypothetical protein